MTQIIQQHKGGTQVKTLILLLMNKLRARNLPQEILDSIAELTLINARAPKRVKADGEGAPYYLVTRRHLVSTEGSVLGAQCTLSELWQAFPATLEHLGRILGRSRIRFDARSSTSEEFRLLDYFLRLGQPLAANVQHIDIVIRNSKTTRTDWHCDGLEVSLALLAQDKELSHLAVNLLDRKGKKLGILVIGRMVPRNHSRPSQQSIRNLITKGIIPGKEAGWVTSTVEVYYSTKEHVEIGYSATFQLSVGNWLNMACSQRQRPDGGPIMTTVNGMALLGGDVYRMRWTPEIQAENHYVGSWLERCFDDDEGAVGSRIIDLKSLWDLEDAQQPTARKRRLTDSGEQMGNIAKLRRMGRAPGA